MTTYFGGRDVLPLPNADDAPFWAHCAQRRLAFQQCRACGTVTHPPIGVCPRGQSRERDWIDAPPNARVFTFTWVHTAAHDAVADRLPYNVVVVEFDGLPGVRLISNVIGTRPGELAVGDRVTLAWEHAGEGVWLPRFRRVAPAAAG